VKENDYVEYSENLIVKCDLEGVGKDGRIILEFIEE
jgi:hypothetical protein